MGNVLGFHNLKEKLCQSCYDDYQTSLNVGSEPLSDVAERGHAHCLRTLIEAGAVSKNSEWRDVLTSALTSAAHSGHLACMRVLVEVGADVNQAEIPVSFSIDSCGRTGTERGDKVFDR